MAKVKKQINDPENYDAMSKPYESQDAANEAMTKFFDELGVIRKKYKIADVLVVMKGSAKDSDGEVGSFFYHAFFGSSMNQLPLSAYAYGQISKDQEETIKKLLAGK